MVNSLASFNRKKYMENIVDMKINQKQVEKFYATIPVEELDYANAFVNGKVVVIDGQTTTLRTHSIGELLINSGFVTACDPLSFSDIEPMLIAVPNGRYPVVLSIDESKNRVIFAMLKLSNEPVTLWKEALFSSEEEGLISDYYVDAGIGCFMDAETAKIILELRKKDEAAFCNLLIESMEGSDYKWANITLDNETGANLITFSSGYGDGFYESYIGFDVNGKVVAVVTDFTMFDSNQFYLADEKAEVVTV